MQVTSERSDNVKYGNNVGNSEESAADTVTSTAERDVVQELEELTSCVVCIAKAQYASITLFCFVCLCLLALVIVLSLAFL